MVTTKESDMSLATRSCFDMYCMEIYKKLYCLLQTGGCYVFNTASPLVILRFIYLLLFFIHLSLISSLNLLRKTLSNGPPAFGLPSALLFFLFGELRNGPNKRYVSVFMKDPRWRDVIHFQR